MIQDLSQQVEQLAKEWQAASSQSDYKAATENLQNLIDQFHARLSGLELARALDFLYSKLSHRVLQIFMWIVEWEQLGGEAVRRVYPSGGWPRNDHLVQIAFGREATRSGDFNQARKCFLEAVRLRPDNPLARHWLGLSLANLKKYREADLWLDSVKRYLLCQASIVCLDSQRMNEIVNNDSNLFEPEYVDGAPSSPPEYVILLSMDRAYFHKFARRILLSLQQKMTDDDWMVHVHVVNPDQECLQAADELRQAEMPLVMSWDYPLLPEQIASETETIEHRTLYACRRLQLWPWALENYKCPVWIVDCDMEAVRPLPTVNMDTDAGFIRFSSTLMPLYQEFFLSAGYIRPTREGIRFARAMAAYIQHYLDQRLWVWSLDQVAIYCVSAWLEEIGLPFRYFSLSPSMIYTKNWSESHAEASSRDDQRVVFVNQVGSSDVSARRTRII